MNHLVPECLMLSIPVCQLLKVSSCILSVADVFGLGQYDPELCATKGLHVH